MNLSSTSKQDKIEANRRMVGKEVYVDYGQEGWTGTVVDVIDEEMFKVSHGSLTVEVSIYDIRSLE